MKKSVMIVAVVVGMMVASTQAQEIAVPIAKVDALAINDAAKAKDAQRKAEGVGVVGRVWGYVKDGVVYMASSTKDAVTEHPYLTAGVLLGALAVDRNNNFSGIWKKEGSGGTVSGNTASSTTTDNSIRNQVDNNSGNVTIIIQSPMTDAVK